MSVACSLHFCNHTWPTMSITQAPQTRANWCSSLKQVFMPANAGKLAFMPAARKRRQNGARKRGQTGARKRGQTGARKRGQIWVTGGSLAMLPTAISANCYHGVMSSMNHCGRFALGFSQSSARNSSQACRACSACVGSSSLKSPKGSATSSSSAIALA